MMAWYFLTAYYYAIVAGPFATQQQCAEMRAYANDKLRYTPSECYQAPLAQPSYVVPETCQGKGGCR